MREQERIVAEIIRAAGAYDIEILIAAVRAAAEEETCVP